jgi:hypothetical protein
MITFDDTREEHQHWRSRNENTVSKACFFIMTVSINRPGYEQEQIKSLSGRRHVGAHTWDHTWLQNTGDDWNTLVKPKAKTGGNHRKTVQRILHIRLVYGIRLQFLN